ncbi:MAG: response regulator [Nitrospirota bacterium]|nr:response regulator [Nitrospirota bacterium]
MNGKTILVVDDEEFIRRMLDRMLQHGNYTVISADCGERAVEIIKGPQGPSVDLVILDIMMPGMGGKKTYHALKAIRDVKILLSSGFGKDGDVQEILNSGADGFLQKPFVLSDLLEATGKTLAG